MFNNGDQVFLLEHASNKIIWNNKAFISIFQFYCAKYIIIYYWWSTKRKGVERLANHHCGHLWLKRRELLAIFEGLKLYAQR